MIWKVFIRVTRILTIIIVTMGQAWAIWPEFESQLSFMKCVTLGKWHLRHVSSCSFIALVISKPGLT